MDSRLHSFIVQREDIAKFGGVVVHPVCSTFTLAREVEYATRQHIFEFLRPNEEGIGSMLQIHHLAPALFGDQVEITSEVVSFNDGELICRFIARVKDRVVAKGETGQRVISKQKLQEIFSTLDHDR